VKTCKPHIWTWRWRGYGDRCDGESWGLVRPEPFALCYWSDARAGQPPGSSILCKPSITFSFRLSVKVKSGFLLCFTTPSGSLAT